jgi:Protein of unknown function (DUF1573)
MKFNVYFLWMVLCCSPSLLWSAKQDAYFPATSFNFGIVQKGAQCEHQFELINRGSQSLIIEYCQTACGCDVPNWKMEPIMPGTSTWIGYKYDSNRLGPFRKTMTVKLKDVEEKIMLTACGFIFGDGMDLNAYSSSYFDCACKSSPVPTPIVKPALRSDTILTQQGALPIHPMSLSIEPEIRDSTMTVIENVTDTTAHFSIPFQFLIYPNPAAHYVEFKWPPACLQPSLQLYDMSGRMLSIYLEKLDGGGRLTWPSLSSGTYLLVLLEKGVPVVSQALVIAEY